MSANQAAPPDDVISALNTDVRDTDGAAVGYFSANTNAVIANALGDVIQVDRWQDGAADGAAVFGVDMSQLPGDTLVFFVSADGTQPGNGSSFNDLSVVMDTGLGATHASYNGSTHTLSLNPASTFSQVAGALNGTANNLNVFFQAQLAFSMIQDGTTDQAAVFSMNHNGTQMVFSASSTGSAGGDGRAFNALRLNMLPGAQVNSGNSDAAYNADLSLLNLDETADTAAIVSAINDLTNFFGAQTAPVIDASAADPIAAASHVYAKVRITSAVSAPALTLIQTGAAGTPARFSFDLGADTVTFEAVDSNSGNGSGYNGLTVRIVDDAAGAESASYNSVNHVLTVHLLL